MKENSFLLFLKENRDGFVSGEEISKKLKVSRSAVWKEAQALRHLGYEIEAQPHLGYRLLSVPDKMFSDELSYRLGTAFIGHTILSYEEVDSTNDVAFQMGERGAKEGLCVFAEYQKKGRGRLGRSWKSPKGKNVLLSILLRPPISPAEVSKITLVAAVSIVKTIEALTGKTLGIKWPNDILFKEKKVSGILTEISAELDRVHFVVVGIGLNLNAAGAELGPQAVSLKEITGKDVSRLSFSQELLRRFEADYRRFKSGRFEELVEDWESFSATSGRRVAVNLSDRQIQGRAIGIDKEGALWVRTDNGLQERVSAGDVRLLRG